MHASSSPTIFRGIAPRRAPGRGIAAAAAISGKRTITASAIAGGSALRARPRARRLFGGAHAPRQRLQQLPRDRAVALHQRPELPVREAIAHQVRARHYRRRAGTSVDQRDLAEMVARAEHVDWHAAAGDRGLAGVDDVEGRGAGALADHRLALGESALLQQAGDLLGLPTVQVGKKRYAL